MTVIQFPVDRPRRATDLSAPAVILVLPVIRIERVERRAEALLSAAGEEAVRRAFDRLDRFLGWHREATPDPLDGDVGPV